MPSLSNIQKLGTGKKIQNDDLTLPLLTLVLYFRTYPRYAPNVPLGLAMAMAQNVMPNFQNGKCLSHTLFHSLIIY